MGKCLEHFAIPVDERDELSQKRFFPAEIYDHFKTTKDPEYWYVKSQYYEFHLGGLKCCSDTPVAFHYVEPETMYYMDYLINNVHPFGHDKNFTEKLPKKLKLEEILSSSDVDSLSPNFQKHKFVHNLDGTKSYGNLVTLSLLSHLRKTTSRQPRKSFFFEDNTNIKHLTAV